MRSIAGKKMSDIDIPSYFLCVFLPDSRFEVQPAPSTDNISQSDLH